MESVKTSIPVSQVMTTVLHKVTANHTISDVKWLFGKYHIRHAPVVNDKEELIGIISLTDIQRLSFGDAMNDSENIDNAFDELLTVEQIMKKDPVTVSQNDTIHTVAKILTLEEFHALPVVDEGKLVGIITTTDIIRMLIDE